MEVKFGKCNYDVLVDSYERALKDSSFVELAKSLDLPKTELMKHTTKLEESVEELKHCKNCQSVHECQNRIRGSVFYPKVQNGKLTFSYIACKYQKKILEDRENSCNYYEMPEALKTVRMKDIHTDDAKRIGLIKWLKNFYDSYEENPHQKGLYLHGSFGSGKTFLICAMLNELAQKKKTDITVVYYPELLRSLKEAFDSDFSKRVDTLKKADILFIDDIGAEAVTPWSRDEILGTILQYRMDATLPTFFSSNLNMKELEAHLSTTKNGVDIVKSRRIIERIRFLTEDFDLVSKNRRNNP